MMSRAPDNCASIAGGPVFPGKQVQMIQRQIIECDRCKETIKLRPHEAPYNMQIMGVSTDLCRDCALDHQAFLLGVPLGEAWSSLSRDEKTKFLADRSKSSGDGADFSPNPPSDEAPEIPSS